MAWNWDVLSQADRNAIVDQMLKDLETSYWKLKIMKRRVQVRPLTTEFTQAMKDTTLANLNNQLNALEVEKAEIQASRGGTTP